MPSVVSIRYRLQFSGLGTMTDEVWRRMASSATARKRQGKRASRRRNELFMWQRRDDRNIEQTDLRRIRHASHSSVGLSAIAWPRARRRQFHGWPTMDDALSDPFIYEQRYSRDAVPSMTPCRRRVSMTSAEFRTTECRSVAYLTGAIRRSPPPCVRRSCIFLCEIFWNLCRFCYFLTTEGTKYATAFEELDFVPRPPNGAPPWTPLGDFHPQIPWPRPLS